MFSYVGYSKVWKLSDINLEVLFDDQTTILTVKDKRCNQIWEQSAFKNQFSVNGTVQKGNSLSIFISGKVSLEVNFKLTEASALEVNLLADEKLSFDEFSFPSAFKTPNKNFYLLYTDGEGLLLPVDDKEYPLGNGITYNCGGGLSMAWMGITDTQFGKGYMAILETPYDAALRTKREDGLITFSPVWLSSMGQFGYSRKVCYYFFDKGGYVAQCKKYREYIWGKNNVLTLRENQKKIPSIEKMIGAVHIYVWDNAREVSFAKELKQSGITKAFILWDANHIPYPEKDYDNRLKELGYASGVYDLYTDIHPNDSVAKPLTNRISSTWLSRTSFPGLYNELYNELTSRKKDGTVYSNNFGHFICPQAVRPEIVKRVDRELSVYPHEAYFLDVYQANGLYECYAPKHPLTREQYAQEIINNYKLLTDKYNMFVGGEWGSDFVGSNSVYVHGMMTLQRTWFGSDIVKKGTIYYYGDWRNNARPTQMLGTRVAPEKYLKYSINEYTRVPLYELVYHDAVVTSWRWEDCNNQTPEIWWKKDLFNILYGSAPLWNLDRNRWDEYKQTFIKSYNNICPWLQKIGYDEMISHSFLSNDHKVQETIFSSGQKVIVNFGDIEFVYDGKTIKPKNYLTLIK